MRISFRLWVLFGTFCLLFSGCQSLVAPEFQRIENVNIDVAGAHKAIIKADALFKNTNDRKITIEQVDIDVAVEDKHVTNIRKDYHLVAQPNSMFTVPVSAEVALKDLDSNLLSTALSLLGGEKKKVHYKGSVRVKAYGFSFNVPVDYEEKVRLSL